MKVWFLRAGLALAVCKHPTEDTNHNSSKISSDHSYIWTNNIVYIKFWARWFLDIEVWLQITVQVYLQAKHRLY
jgi:hypothetical protein